MVGMANHTVNNKCWWLLLLLLQLLLNEPPPQFGLFNIYAIVPAQIHSVMLSHYFKEHILNN